MICRNTKISWVLTVKNYLDNYSSNFLKMCTSLCGSPIQSRATANLSLEGVGDERQMHWVYALDTLLDNVIAILIFHALQNVAIQLLCYLNLS